MKRGNALGKMSSWKENFFSPFHSCFVECSMVYDYKTNPHLIRGTFAFHSPTLVNKSFLRHSKISFHINPSLRFLRHKPNHTAHTAWGCKERVHKISCNLCTFSAISLGWKLGSANLVAFRIYITNYQPLVIKKVNRKSFQLVPITNNDQSKETLRNHWGQ